jgi:hypothetical protein
VLAGAPEIAASTGSACHEGHERASAVILAMGVPADEALGSVRLTLGRGTTEDEVERAADALVGLWRGIAGSRPASRPEQPLARRRACGDHDPRRHFPLLEEPEGQERRDDCVFRPIVNTRIGPS